MGHNPIIDITLHETMVFFFVLNAPQFKVQGLWGQDLHHYIQQFQVQTETGDKHHGKQLHSFLKYIYQVVKAIIQRQLVKNLGLLEGLCVFHPKYITHRGF